MKSKVIALAGLAALFAGEARAVIGRPLTPLSYAGVARRTTRRAVVGTAAVAGTAVVAGTAAVAAATITTLPHGCVPSVVGSMTYQHCGNVYYQPQYSGPNVVYAQVPPPQG
jgi:hypothetical protein